MKGFNANGCPDHNCGLTVDDIRDDEFSCRGGSTKHIIYRAVIGGTEQYNAQALVSLIHSWVASGSASITVLSHRLHLDKDCNSLLNDLNEPDCPLQTNTDSESLGGNAGGFSSFLIGAIIFSVLILVLILVIVVIVLKHFKSKRERYKISMDIIPYQA